MCALLTSHLPDTIFLFSLGSRPLLRKGNAQDAENWERKQYGLYQGIAFFRGHLIKRGHLISFCPGRIFVQSPERR